MTSRTALPTQTLLAPERALPPQTRLEEFEIETVLAQSSFGVIYRAYDHALKMHVAIKEYLPDALALRSAETQVVLRARAHVERFEMGLQAFIGEAQTLARADHPALLRVRRLLLRHGTAYRVMRYCPGPTLLAYRREFGGTPAPASMRAWLDALLGALDALHEEGCVHAAVAPGNILLRPSDKPLLLDFDAVRAALISDRTQSMMAALEPCYEPIEQRAPGPHSVMGPWTDLYSLAATLHFCIGGQLPAPPQAASATPRFEPLGEVWERQQLLQPTLGEAPHWLGALDACLREDPQERPQSVARLMALLDAGQRAAAKRRPAQVPVLDPGRDGFDMPQAYAATGGPARPSPPTATTVTAAPVASAESAAAAATTASAEAAETSEPAATAAARLQPAPAGTVTPAQYEVIADLDKTFAFIAAQASEDAEAKPATADDAAAEAAAAEDAAADAPTEAAAAAIPATVPPPSHRQLAKVGAAVAVMLVVVSALAVWLVRDPPSDLFGAAPATPAPIVPQGAEGRANASDEAAAKALRAADAALAKSPPQAGPAARTAATAATTPAARTSQTAQSAQTPQSAPTDQAAQAAPAPNREAPPEPPAGSAPPKSKVPVVSSPREACGERTRFSLYQCMQTQCAKRNWAQHPQCVQFRKEQRL